MFTDVRRADLDTSTCRRSHSGAFMAPSPPPRAAVLGEAAAASPPRTPPAARKLEAEDGGEEAQPGSAAVVGRDSVNWQASDHSNASGDAANGVPPPPSPPADPQAALDKLSRALRL